jgi:hypothetical protein
MENKQLQTVQRFGLEKYSENIEGKLKFCQQLIQSGLLPKHYGRAQAVLTAILMGQELGFSPMAALRVVVVINGVPTLSAAGMKAKAIKAGGQFKTVEWTDEVCTIKVTRQGWTEPEVVSYTMNDAKQQGLTGKDNWKRMPKQMLYARAVTMAIRNVFADVVEGVYGTEEMLDSCNIDFKMDDEGSVVEIAQDVPIPPEIEETFAVEAPMSEPTGKTYTYKMGPWVNGFDVFKAKLKMAGGRFNPDTKLWESSQAVEGFDSYLSDGSAPKKEKSFKKIKAVEEIPTPPPIEDDEIPF